MSEKYGVIFEQKFEQPLIMEGKPMAYEEAVIRMQEVSKSSHVIRVAVFKLEYETGNETLI